MQNPFGFGVEGLDVPAFLGVMRLLFAGIALGAGLAMARMGDDRRIGRTVLWIAITGHALAWLATVFPLPNLYGANGSLDRENHLGWANVVALGFSPLYTFQVNQIHFEPLWPLLTAALAGFNVDRIALVMHWAPLFAGIALLLSVRFTWVRVWPGRAGLHTEASFAALGALLLLAVPGDFWGAFSNPWALTFLLKPNHALGLVLAPLAAVTVARAGTWKTRLMAGLVLQLLGWVFVMHMALFVAGLVAFVAISWGTRRDDRRKDLIDVATAVGANLVLVSPYLLMLLVAYPIVQGRTSLSGLSERPFEVSLRLGALLVLSGFGAWRAYRKGGRLGRILSTQWLTAHVIWQIYPLLGLVGLDREPDEAFYWCRFWTGLFAGAFMFSVAQQGFRRMRRVTMERVSPRIGAAAALSLVLLLPSLLPAWWDPSTMDRYYPSARQPLPDWITEPTRFIRASTPPDAVFTGDRNYARWIAAYGARRVLLSRSLNWPNDALRRTDLDNAILHGGSGPLVAEGIERYGLQYLLVTGTPLEQAPAVTIEYLLKRPDLQVVYDRTFAAERVVIFKMDRHAGTD